MHVAVFRWKAVGPLLAFGALGAAAWLLFAERIARRAIETVGTAVIGAKVEIRALALSLRHRGVGPPGARRLGAPGLGRRAAPARRRRNRGLREAHDRATARRQARRPDRARRCAPHARSGEEDPSAAGRLASERRGRNCHAPG